MDKNTIIGFVLIAAVLFGFAWWQKPSDKEEKKTTHRIYKRFHSNNKENCYGK